MKKHVIVIMVILLLFVGLSGCFGVDYVNDLIDNPNDYLGKVTTVSAHYYAYDNSIYDEYNPFNRLRLVIPKSVDDSMLIDKGHYYFRGTLKQSSVLTYFEVSEIFTENPTDYTPFCLLSVFILLIVGYILVRYREQKKEEEQRWEEETEDNVDKESEEDNGDKKRVEIDEKQRSYDELKKSDLVFMLKYGDFLGILKELKEGEVVKALTRSNKPPNAKVFITNKRIIMRKYLSTGTELGVDLDINYSDIDKKSIAAHGIIGKVHFKTKGQHIQLDAPVSKYKIRDIIKELVENEEKEK